MEPLTFNMKLFLYHLKHIKYLTSEKKLFAYISDEKNKVGKDKTHPENHSAFFLCSRFRVYTQ